MCLKWRNGFGRMRGEANSLGNSLGLATKETTLERDQEQMFMVKKCAT